MSSNRCKGDNNDILSKIRNLWINKRINTFITHYCYNGNPANVPKMPAMSHTDIYIERDRQTDTNTQLIGQKKKPP